MAASEQARAACRRFCGAIACTPLGCIILTRSVHASLEGMNAIVIGRSNLVGRPLVQLLLNEKCDGDDRTFALARSAAIMRPRDLVYAAVGKPEMVRGELDQAGATVIDSASSPAGHRRQKRLVGDVAFQEALEVAGAITPVLAVSADDGGLPVGEYVARRLRDAGLRSPRCKPRPSFRGDAIPGRCERVPRSAPDDGSASNPELEVLALSRPERRLFLFLRRSMPSAISRCGLVGVPRSTLPICGLEILVVLEEMLDLLQRDVGQVAVALHLVIALGQFRRGTR